MAIYKVPVLETFAWQRPVLGGLDDPPGSPTKGDRYLIWAGSGAWIGKTDSIAEYNGSTWDFITPTPGMAIWSIADDFPIFYRSAGYWDFITSDLTFLAEEVNDFLVASGAEVWVKKTLAETKTILGVGTGGIDFLVAQVFS